MTERVPVASTDEFDGDDRKIIDVDGVEIGVLAVDGEYYAVLNRCPHQYGPVAEGELGHPIDAEVPEVGERVEETYDRETTVLRCPLHGWGFDIESGRNIADPEVSRDLVTYDVVVEAGTVYLER